MHCVPTRTKNKSEHDLAIEFSFPFKRIPHGSKGKKCSHPSRPLADIVRFGPLHITISLTILKRVY